MRRVNTYVGGEWVKGYERKPYLFVIVESHQLMPQMEISKKNNISTLLRDMEKNSRKMFLIGIQEVVTS